MVWLWWVNCALGCCCCCCCWHLREKSTLNFIFVQNTHTHTIVGALYIKISQSFHYLCHAIYKNIRKMVFMMIVCMDCGKWRRRKKILWKEIEWKQNEKNQVDKETIQFRLFFFQSHIHTQWGRKFIFFYLYASIILNRNWCDFIFLMDARAHAMETDWYERTKKHCIIRFFEWIV